MRFLLCTIDAGKPFETHAVSAEQQGQGLSGHAASLLQTVEMHHGKVCKDSSLMACRRACSTNGLGIVWTGQR